MSELANAVEKIARAATGEEVADIVRSAARLMSGADGVAVVLKDGDRVRYVDEDAVGPLWKGRDFPIEACISGWAIQHDQTVIIEDVYQDPRIPLEVYRATFVRSCVMTPVGRGDPFGCIGAYWAETRLPSKQEVDALDAIARATAVALENLRLRQSLADALGRAAESNRVKSEFLTNMSHEIRTPLNGVIGGLAVLAAEAGATPRQADLIRLLGDSTRQLEDVLKTIFDFVRIQGDVQDIDIQSIDVASEILEVVDFLRGRLDQKGLALEIEIDPSIRIRARTDGAALKRIVANLLLNAINFTPTGKVSVRARLDDGMGVITVADTGVGVAETDQTRIFSDFAQLDGSATRTVGGMGLGLTICRRLLDNLGGDISVQSALGQGSVFTVRLPLPAAPEEVIGAEDVVADTAPRILVVDDHPTNRRVMGLLLAQAGAESVMAVNGAEAVELFANERFDVVLMDVQMPVMDGLEATRRIRALEADRGVGPTPVIMVTANAMPEDARASRTAGADRHLAKPVNPVLLFTALSEALRATAVPATLVETA